MKLTWLGHSCFKLEESTGTSVLADPYSSQTVGLDMVPSTCDVVTLSNKSMLNDGSLNKILGDPQVMCQNGSLEYEGISINGFAIKQKIKHKDDHNIIYTYRMDGVDICHLGSIKVEEDVKVIESIGYVNILMIPIGGGKHSIDAQQAQQYIEMLMPNIVIPMQYRDKDIDIDLDRLDEFLELFPKSSVIYADSDTMEFDRADFEDDSTKIIIFEKK